MKLFYVLIFVCIAVVAVAAIESKNGTSSPDKSDPDDAGYEERRKKPKPTTKKRPPSTKKPPPPPTTTKKPHPSPTTTKKHVPPTTTTTKKHVSSTTTTTKHPHSPSTKSTHRPKPTTKRPVITPESRNLCQQSILAKLNPTKSCKEGCLVTCAKKSANTEGRCAVCRDECCEDNCTGYDCIPVSQITELINTALLIYEKVQPDPSTQGEGNTEAPPADYEQTTVEEATNVTEVVENGE